MEYFFWDDNCDPSITILAEYSVTEPADETRTFKVSFSLAPNLNPSMTFSGGVS